MLKPEEAAAIRERGHAHDLRCEHMDQLTG